MLRQLSERVPFEVSRVEGDPLGEVELLEVLEPLRKIG